MEKDLKHVTHKVLHLALEIFSVMIGESFTIVKFGDLIEIMVPSPHSPAPEKSDEKKILEVLSQVMELLTGENQNDKSQRNKEDILRDVKRHKELYMETTVMEDQPTGGSDKKTIPERRLHPPHHPGDFAKEHRPAGGSDKRTTLERRLHPPHHFGISTQEHYLAGGSDKRTTLERRLHPPHHFGISTQKGHPAGGSDKRTTLERRLHPTLKGQTTPDHDQIGGMEAFDLDQSIITFKVEEEETTVWDGGQAVEMAGRMGTTEGGGEDTLMRGDQLCTKEARKMVSVKQEETPVRCDQRSTETAKSTIKVEEHKKTSVKNRKEMFGTIMMDNAEIESMRSDQQDTGKISVTEAVRDQQFGETAGIMVTMDKETSVRDDLPSTEDLGMVMEVIEDFPDVDVAHSPMEEHLALSSYCAMEVDGGAPLFSRGMSSSLAHIFPGFHEEPSGVVATRGRAQETCPSSSPGSDWNVAQKADSLLQTTLIDGELFSCFECGKVFTMQRSLDRHMALHTGRKLLLCRECGKNFRSNSDLESHQKIHTGERPFPCSVCGLRFRLKSDLSRHFMIHTGEKPFTCSECNYRTRRKSCLIVHLRTHAKSRQLNTQPA